MKKTLVCLLIAFSAAFALPNVTAQNKDQKDKKDQAAPEVKISAESLDPETKKVLELAEGHDPAAKKMIEAGIKEALASAAKVESELKFQNGTIAIGDNLAKINLPKNFRYLDPKQSERVLVELWGNRPQDAKTLGMIVPADISLSGHGSWGVVISYQEDGYVEDDDAARINYDDLLKQMKEGEAEENEERKKQGYDSMVLVGWAAPPRYDQASHKLYWAKEFQVGDYQTHTLNYDIRVLGRRGVLSLNAIAGMDQLQAVEKDMQQVLGFVEFNEGNRYGDYVAGVDKVAAYGIGALIAGKVAAKAGLFKLLLLFLAKFWKLAIIAAVGIGTLVQKLLSNRKKEEPMASIAE